MDIRELSEAEAKSLYTALDKAIYDLGGYVPIKFSQDSHGIKWKVGEGMWTPSYGRNINESLYPPEMSGFLD